MDTVRHPQPDSETGDRPRDDVERDPDEEHRPQDPRHREQHRQQRHAAETRRPLGHPVGDHQEQEHRHQGDDQADHHRLQQIVLDDLVEDRCPGRGDDVVAATLVDLVGHVPHLCGHVVTRRSAPDGDDQPQRLVVAVLANEHPLSVTGCDLVQGVVHTRDVLVGHAVTVGVCGGERLVERRIVRGDPLHRHQRGLDVRLTVRQLLGDVLVDRELGGVVSVGQQRRVGDGPTVGLDEDLCL